MALEQEIWEGFQVLVSFSGWRQRSAGKACRNLSSPLSFFPSFNLNVPQTRPRLWAVKLQSSFPAAAQESFNLELQSTGSCTPAWSCLHERSSACVHQVDWRAEAVPQAAGEVSRSHIEGMRHTPSQTHSGLKYNKGSTTLSQAHSFLLRSLMATSFY